PRVIGLGVAPSRCMATVWNCDAKTRIFLPLKSARWRIGVRATTADCEFMNSPTPWSPLSAPSASISLRTPASAATRCPSAMDAMSRGGQDLETLVDAGQKFRRHDLTLNGAELHALGLPR